MNVVFGLGIGLCMHVYKIKKWCPTQRIAVKECYVIDQGDFEAMKMLSGGRVPH